MHKHAHKQSGMQHQKQSNRIHIAMNDDDDGGIAHSNENENVRGAFSKEINKNVVFLFGFFVVVAPPMFYFGMQFFHSIFCSLSFYTGSSDSKQTWYINLHACMCVCLSAYMF